jgi:peptide/nickel transport system substrate-binding protein
MSGPYKIQEYVPKDHVTIVRWDGYKRRATTVESGETHMVTVVPAQHLPRLESSKNSKVEKRPWVGTPRIWLLNVTRPPTDEPKVRQSINYAIDKDVIVNTLYAGISTKAIAPMAKVMLDDPSLHNYYPYDPTKAMQLLEEAGWIAGSNGIGQRNGQPLRLVLNAIDYGGGPEPLAQLIQGQLRKIGIDVQIKAQARPPWYEDNYHGATNGPIMFLRSGDLDGLYALFHSSNIGGNFNWSLLRDPEVDELLERGRELRDPQQRRALYLELEKKLLDMAVSVPLVDELSVWVMRANVNGLKFNGFTYPVVADVWIRK